jgi:DNA-binding MarR family transcriptional regulator
MDSIDPLVATMQETFGIFRRRLMGNLFIFAKDKGLTMAQFGALLHIYHKVGCGVSDIGNDLGVTNSAASQMLERLVQLKLIIRSEDPSDRRGKQIALTDKGRQILQEGSLANRIWIEELARKMSADEQKMVRESLIILIEKTNQLDTPTVDKPDDKSNFSIAADGPSDSSEPTVVI